MPKRKHRGGSTAPTPWQPLVRMEPRRPTAEQYAATAEALGSDEAAHRALDPANQEIWGNDRYRIHVERRGDGSVLSLSIRRLDRKPAHDWRHFMRIKDQLAGRNAEAVELYPAHDRLVDQANQYWLWCLPPGVRYPLGFPDRRVENDAEPFPGARQRPDADFLDVDDVPPEADVTPRPVVFAGDPDDPDEVDDEPDEDRPHAYGAGEYTESQRQDLRDAGRGHLVP